MVSIHVKTHVGPDDTINLTVPTQFRETDLDVLVVLKPAAAPSQSGNERAIDWPDRFFEGTFGSLREELFVGLQQSEADPRDAV